MIRWIQGLMIAVTASSLCLGETPEAVRILGVVPGEAGELSVRLSFPDSLHGTRWQLFRCEPEAGDPSPVWSPIGAPIVLSATVKSVPLGEPASPVALFLLKQADPPRDEAGQAMRLSRLPAPDGSAAFLRVELLDDADTHRLFATGFEASEGIELGALPADLEWNVVGEVVVATAPGKAGQAVRLAGNDARLSRRLDTGDTVVRVEYALYVSTTGVVQAVTQAERPPKRSGSISYHPSRGFLAFDGDGQGGGRWELIPDSTFFNQWVTVAVELDYETKTWSIALNEGTGLDDLGFRDADLASFSEMVVYAGDAGEMFVDEVKVTRTSKGEEIRK